MEEESMSKRRRLERAPPDNTGEVLLSPSSTARSIDSLPDAVLQYCFSFIGKGHYRYVAGTSRRFNHIYSIKHEKKTTMERAVSSVSSAELFLQDAREEAVESTSDTLGTIFINAVICGNVNVLKWAHDKGHVPEAWYFERGAATRGHVAVLQWAEEKRLDWYSNELVYTAAENGQVHIFDWIHSTGKVIPVGVPARHAAASGQCAVLNWLKEHDLLGSINDLWHAACYHDRLDVLDWLFNNGYRVDPDVIEYSIFRDHRDALLWAREHDLAWDTSTCTDAVLHNNLPLLQWLREHDCPWDSRVIRYARVEGFEDIAQWAIDNGCPTEEEDLAIF